MCLCDTSHMTHGMAHDGWTMCRHMAMRERRERGRKLLKSSQKKIKILVGKVRGKEKGKGKKKKKKREKGKERRKKKKKEREIRAWKGKEKKKKKKGLRFPVFRLSEVVSPRIKVGLLDESYEQVPKTKDVEVSPTLVISCLVAM